MTEIVLRTPFLVWVELENGDFAAKHPFLTQKNGEPAIFTLKQDRSDKTWSAWLLGGVVHYRGVSQDMAAWAASADVITEVFEVLRTPGHPDADKASALRTKLLSI